MEQTGFSQAEADEFREVFMSWNEKDRMFEDDDALPDAKPDGFPVRVTPGADAPKELSKDCVRRLLRSLGVNLDQQHRGKLEHKIEELNSHSRIDFSDFLRL